MTDNKDITQPASCRIEAVEKPSASGRVAPFALYFPSGYQPSKAMKCKWEVHTSSTNAGEHYLIGRTVSSNIFECASRQLLLYWPGSKSYLTMQITLYFVQSEVDLVGHTHDSVGGPLPCRCAAKTPMLPYIQLRLCRPILLFLQVCSRRAQQGHWHPEIH